MNRFNTSESFVVICNNGRLFKYEPGHEKTCLMPYANNKGADPRSLISAFVVRYQDRMIPLVYICEISRF